MPDVDPLFRVHKLNADGLERAQKLAEGFSALLEQVAAGLPASRELSLAKTHLEEACFYAKKALAPLYEGAHV